MNEDSYLDWRKRIDGLTYYFKIDMEKLLKKTDGDFDKLFKCYRRQHPPILKMVLSKKISVETFVILEDILSFANRLDKQISETVLWPKMHDRMIRYRPFMKFNITKYKISLRDKMKER